MTGCAVKTCALNEREVDMRLSVSALLATLVGLGGRCRRVGAALDALAASGDLERGGGGARGGRGACVGAGSRCSRLCVLSSLQSADGRRGRELRRALLVRVPSQDLPDRRLQVFER